MPDPPDAAHLFRRGYDFAHAGTDPGAEIDAAVIFPQLFQRQPVSGREIFDMNVIADAGTVGRIVIGAENPYRFQFPVNGFQHQRNEMRFRQMALADRSVRRTAGGIKITQGYVL